MKKIAQPKHLYLAKPSSSKVVQMKYRKGKRFAECFLFLKIILARKYKNIQKEIFLTMTLIFPAYWRQCFCQKWNRLQMKVKSGIKIKEISSIIMALQFLQWDTTLLYSVGFGFVFSGTTVKWTIFKRKVENSCWTTGLLWCINCIKWVMDGVTEISNNNIEVLCSTQVFQIWLERKDSKVFLAYTFSKCLQSAWNAVESGSTKSILKVRNVYYTNRHWTPNMKVGDSDFATSGNMYFTL